MAVAYLEDGPDLVLMAMNGWQPGNRDPDGPGSVRRDLPLA